MINKKLFVFVFAFIFSVFLFLAQPNDTHAGMAMMPTGCCQVDFDTCEDYVGDVGIEECEFLGGTLFSGETCNLDSGLCSGISSSVPTISEWGLIATAAVLGFIGFYVVRRRKAEA